MKQGLKKTTIFLIAFFATTFLINIQKEPAFAHKVPTSITLNCADNAVAPLNNLIDIQTFLSCNGFNPGPIDGLAGSRTDGAIKSFQKTVGLVADGQVGPATKQAMRSYSSVSFTFQGSGWGHGVGLSQYGTKGLTELGASFCSNTSSCSSSEVVSYYFQGTSVKQLSEISLSSPDISTNNNAL